MPGEGGNEETKWPVGARLWELPESCATGAKRARTTIGNCRISATARLAEKLDMAHLNNQLDFKTVRSVNALDALLGVHDAELPKSSAGSLTKPYRRPHPSSPWQTDCGQFET